MIALLVLGVSAAFIERFETLDKWIPSTATKEGVDADLAKYNGKWRLDDGLVLDSVAAHSAISTVFAPVDPKDNDLVVQYMVNPTKGLDCGGAYLKIFSHKPAFKPEQMTDKTPYTIMFGPDKCGGSDKVHFIFRHQNPVSKQVEEKHLAATPPSQLAAGQTNLYTLAVFRNQTFEILINNNSVKTGSLLEAFEPPVNPEKGHLHI